MAPIKITSRTIGCDASFDIDKLPWKQDSWGCFPLDGAVRQNLIALIEWCAATELLRATGDAAGLFCGRYYWDVLSMVIIMVNCITLAMYNPYDRDCLTQKCQTLEMIEAALALHLDAVTPCGSIVSLALSRGRFRFRSSFSSKC